MASAKGGDQYTYGETIASPVGIISYPKVWEAVTNDLSQKRQFQCSILIPKQGADIKAVVAESMKVAQALFGDRYKTLTAFGERNCPIKDGDTKEAGDPAIGHWILPASCSEERRPFVVDKNNRPIGDHSEIYGGAIGLIWIQPMAYSTKYGNGVKFMLKGVQKIADGKPFGSAAFDPASVGFKAPDVPEYLRGHVETKQPMMGVATSAPVGNGRPVPFTQADADKAAAAHFAAASSQGSDDSIPF